MSNDDFRQEKELGKVYDHKLMLRLLQYAKPYAGLIALAIILLIFITVADLARPYIIKIAIDDHINAFSRPLAALEKKEFNSLTKELSQLAAPDASDAVEETQLATRLKTIENYTTHFQGKYLIREEIIQEQLPELGTTINWDRYQIVSSQGDYYLIDGVIDINRDYQVNENKATLTADGQVFSAQKLDKDQLAEFRRYDIDQLIKLAVIFLAIITAGFVLNYLQIYLLNYTGQKIIYHMRQEVFQKIQRLAISFFDKNPVGRLVTRATNDVEALKEMYTEVVVNLFKDIFLLVGIVIIMLKLNPQLAAVSLSLVPVIFIVAFIYQKKARRAYRTVRKKLAELNTSLQENISGMKIIQVFNKEKAKFKEFEQINQGHYQASLKEILTYALFRPSMDLIYSLALAILIWYGGGQVIQGALEFGVLYAFINYTENFFRPINDLSEKYTIMQSAMASSERIFQLLDEEETIKDPEVEDVKHISRDRERVTGEIEFKNVWFAYDKENWVLKNINLHIKPGETVAIVGATGAGKSSIINLLSRFYDIQKGEILIDKKNIKSLPQKELRRNIGMVLQDVFIFSDTVKENISLGNKEISWEKVKAAAKAVNAHSFIEQLPHGYDQVLTERGSTLSTGQRQLLSFARALAFDPPILVLDEATANIDTDTEIMIQEALKTLTKNRTTIVIAHRLSTIQHADKIVVLHQGTIREIGTHQELLEKEGLYYDLYRLQYQ